MPYRVVMEVVPRPDDTPEWIWNETNVASVSSNGGKGWTAKLNSSDSIYEYDVESDATTKMDELFAADSTNRRYKVIEV
tara:strand:- start:395 stop:631 length:237 start_codon:yes stop_codon:yes gene_type:complete